MCVSLVLDHQIGEAANLELGDQEASLKKWHSCTHMNVDLKGMQEIARTGVGEKAFQREREHHIQNPRRKKTSI